ncbi:2e2ddbfe-333b-44ee-a265-1b69e1967c93 [Sclerotinia trifoliorum]|uniref:2e2ddbfe-333b-44ee-a265-1b69e1967c93 n=1 Tax=Sclerotinia trifoliorum TaxID=28548 RepID=A0A8H2VNF6_9HELO|nr:2e2ddbfe-333b-44ee-a265-1b69e1967c93 [Sclerotinia trifoliorum]
MADLDTEEAPPVKKKFSLFKKKLTQSPAPNIKPGQNHTDAFSRAKDLFPLHVKEKEIKREKKAVTLERKRSSQSREKSSSSPRLEKRRKVGDVDVDVDVKVDLNDLGSETEDEELRARESSLSTPDSSKSQTRSPQQKRRSPTSLMGRFAKDVESKGNKSGNCKAVTKGYISLSDSETEDIVPVRQTISRSSSPVVAPANSISVIDDDDEDAFSEEEFPELLAKARENKRLADLAQQRSNAEWANRNHEPDRSAADDDVFQDKQKGELVLEIFISSRLENTKNLVIKRKLHQRLREVRQAWCDKQQWNGVPMPEELKDAILLTWRNKRLFDSMTCASLNLDFNTNGDLDSTGEGFNSGRIHMEAWTNDLWDECCKAASAEEISDDEEEPVEVVPEPIAKMRLILKAQSKDIKEFKTYVRATTTVQKLVDGFRSMNRIPAEKKIILSFDGDQLDVESTVEESGFDDMDTVDVLIR